jgi:hypothetical protein
MAVLSTFAIISEPKHGNSEVVEFDSSAMVCIVGISLKLFRVICWELTSVGMFKFVLENPEVNGEYKLKIVSVRITATDTIAHLDSLRITHLPSLRLPVALIACINYLRIALNIFSQRICYTKTLSAVY